MPTPLSGVSNVPAKSGRRPHWKPIVAPLSNLTRRSDEGLAEYVRQHASTLHHQVGTCKMGSDALAVVDDRLRAIGVDGLRVVDASGMPRITSGNTNAPTIVIAERAADPIKRDA